MRFEPVSRSEKKWSLDLGATVLDEKSTKFTVWAPNVSQMNLVILSKGEEGGDEPVFAMEKTDDNYFIQTADVGDGTKYLYLLDQNKRRADPATRFQPQGVHGPSQVVDDSNFNWTDECWHGVPEQDLIIYELHVGTFTQEGRFDSIIPYIDYLSKELGVTAIELMPVSQFPGSRNWGYDSVFMFAPQNSYGGPRGLKELVNTCHERGLAVILDVVYNHVGPEGNYLQDFGPYFSYKYHTPWGPSFNYDDRGCDNVRKYVIENALYWIINYHFDGLRLDAIHGIFDFSPKHILEELKDTVDEWTRDLDREVSIIAESDLNDPKIVKPKEICGYGLDAQWSDDFHHAVHSYLTGEKFGYYEDFGSLECIAKSLTDGFVYDDKYSAFRGRKHGYTSKDIQPKKFVVFLQNHDQVGNRPDGLRLASLLGDTRILKVAAGLLILSPYVPLLFMGEEFRESAPFFYFISHTDPDLVKAVREGRKKEFESHNWTAHYIDPQDELTFEKSKINHNLRFSNTSSGELFEYYRELIMFRKSHPALAATKERNLRIAADAGQKTLIIQRGSTLREQEQLMLLVYNLGSNQSRLGDISEKSAWKKIHDSNFVSSSPHLSKESLSQSAPEVISPGTDFVIPPFTLAIYSRTS